MQDQSLDLGNCLWLFFIYWQLGSMAGCHSVATAKIKKVANKNLLSTHCMYRCEYVAFQKLSPELNNIIIRPV